MFNKLLFRKSCRLLHIVENHCRTRHASGDRMAHAHCMVYNYKHTLRICNTLLFHSNSGCTNALQCYFTHTLRLLLFLLALIT